MSEMQYVRFRLSPGYGHAVLRVRGRMYKLKAPWCRPIFSERHSLRVKVIPIAFGWRINIAELRL